jgi:membrane protein required for colicin V production
MNWLDIVLLIVLAGSVLSSLRKGLTREIIGLVSVVLALIFGVWFYGMAGAILLPYVSSRWVANLGGFAMVFIAVMLTGSVVSFVVGKVLKVSGLSWVDRLLGAAFGALRALLIATAMLTALMAFAPAGKPPAAVVDSKLAPYVVDASRLCAAMAPHELKEGFRRTYEQVRSAWNNALDHGIQDGPGGEKAKRK